MYVASLTILALLGLSLATDPALLAPGPDDLARMLARTEERVERCETIGRALARLHNRWAELIATGRMRSSCDDPEARSIAARGRVFGASHRDAVQSARAQERRLDRMIREPIIAPSLDARSRRQAELLKSRIDAQVRRWLELQAWHHEYIERSIRRCASSLTLVPAHGIPASMPCALGECGGPVAIIGIGGGKICPGEHPADGAVVIVPDGRACYGESGCACVPVAVFPGAVLRP